MSFTSEKQKNFMFAKKPEIAKKWVKEAGDKVVIKKKRKIIVKSKKK